MRIGALARLVQYTGAAQREYATQTGAAIPDVTLPGLPNAQSQIAAPVMRTGELLGVVAVESARGAAFGPEDEAVLEVVAQMLAGAIEEERLSSDAPGDAPGRGTTPEAATDCW